MKKKNKAITQKEAEDAVLKAHPDCKVVKSKSEIINDIAAKATKRSNKKNKKESIQG